MPKGLATIKYQMKYLKSKIDEMLQSYEFIGLRHSNDQLLSEHETLQSAIKQFLLNIKTKVEEVESKFSKIKGKSIPALEKSIPGSWKECERLVKCTIKDICEKNAAAFQTLPKDHYELLEIIFNDLKKPFKLKESDENSLNQVIKEILEGHLAELNNKLSIEKSPSCFICYAWGNAANSKKVHKLARLLKMAGVNVILDIWDNQSNSVSVFTAKLIKADSVIVIGTPSLKEKWENYVSQGKSRRKEGEDYHGSVVCQELEKVDKRLNKKDSQSHGVKSLLLSGEHEASFPDVVEALASDALDFRDWNNLHVPFFTLLNIIYKRYDGAETTIDKVKQDCLKRLGELGQKDNLIEQSVKQNQNNHELSVKESIEQDKLYILQFTKILDLNKHLRRKIRKFNKETVKAVIKELLNTGEEFTKLEPLGKYNIHALCCYSAAFTLLTRKRSAEAFHGNNGKYITRTERNIKQALGIIKLEPDQTFIHLGVEIRCRSLIYYFRKQSKQNLIDVNAKFKNKTALLTAVEANPIDKKIVKELLRFKNIFVDEALAFAKKNHQKGVVKLLNSTIKQVQSLTSNKLNKKEDSVVKTKNNDLPEVNILNLDNSNPGFDSSSDSFVTILEKKRIYIDKSLLVKEVINNSDTVQLITRPRRWGKTLNMRMLEAFFGYTDSKSINWFKQLNIWRINDGEYQKYYGKYPVIFLTFKDIKNNEFVKAKDKFKNLVQEVYDLHYTAIKQNNLLVRLTDRQKSLGEKFSNTSSVITDAELTDSLKLLTQILKAAYQQPVILLIDEYDTPINASYNNNYYQEMIDFIRDLLSPVLKGNNENLFKAVITGILRISKEGIFSGLNNITNNSVLKYSYAECFGFTDSETRKLMQIFNPSADFMQRIEDYYGGYQIGDISLFNPWQLLIFAKIIKLILMIINCLNRIGKIPQKID